MRTGGSDTRVSEDLLRQACAELGRRVRAGERYGAEDAFAAWPALASDADSAIELIYAEFTLREELGQPSSPEEWYARFPQWQDRLRRLFEVHLAARTPLAPGDTVAPTWVLTSAASHAAADGPGADAGPYELLGEIGRGGMGVVYKARHRRLNRVVALKMILSGQHAGPDELGRFRREAEAVARLQHPNIVQVFEVGERREPGGPPCPYMALEFVPGGSLAQRIGRTPLPPREAARLVETLAGALEHAHAHGVVHRDLKPANVLLIDDGQPKVTDFGLARRLDATGDATHTGAVLGTPGYMAPEQAAGDARTAGPAADVYALGAVLYELLTGRPPFLGADWVTLLEQVRSADPVPPARLEPGVPHDLETVALKCLEKEPSRRYLSAAALAEDLRRFLDGRPVLARPPGAAERLRKLVRRNRGPALAALLVLVSLVGGIIATTWQAVRATAARQLAEANETRAREGEASARAAADAERAAKEAEAAQRLQAEAVTALLESVFLDLNPEQAAGDLREQLVGRLDDLASALDKERAREPLVRARLRNALAIAQAGLGEYAKALALYQQALEERRAHLGPDHPEVLSILNNLASAYQSAGRPGEAVPLFEEALAGLRRNPGPDHPNTLTTLDNLAGAYRDVGQFDRAVSLHEQALAGRKARLGPDHPDTLSSLNNVGSAYRAAGRASEGVPLLEQALAGRKAKLGPDHPETLTTMNDLAVAYQDAGRLEEAVPLLEQALAQRKTKLGPDQPHTLNSLHNLGAAYRAAGRLGEAVPLLEQALAGRKARLGPDHPDTLKTLYMLAKAHWDAGRIDQAMPLLEQVLAGRKARLGPDHPDTLAALNDLGVAYRTAGHLDRAVPLLEQGLAGMRKTYGPDHPNTLAAMTNLAVSYRVAGRLDRAVPLCEEALAGQRKKLGPDHLHTLSSLANLARTYEEQGQPERGEALWRELFPLARKRLGPESAFVADALTAFSRNLLRQHKDAEAETVLRDLLALRRAKWPDNWSMSHAQSLLGASLLGQKKPAEAEPLLREGYEGMKRRRAQIPPAAKPSLAEAAERLVQVYEALGRPEQAAEWRKEVDAIRTATAPAAR